MSSNYRFNHKSHCPVLSLYAELERVTTIRPVLNTYTLYTMEQLYGTIKDNYLEVNTNSTGQYMVLTVYSLASWIL